MSEAMRRLEAKRATEAYGEEKPEWSCGGYVFEDVLQEFTVEHRIIDGQPVDVPIMGPGFTTAELLDSSLPLAIRRWLRPEECPDHSEVTAPRPSPHVDERGDPDR